MLTIKQTANFKKQIKKLHKNQKRDLDKAIKIIAKNPSIGKVKTGELNGVFVYKFKMINQLMLLAYLFNETEVFLIGLGSHQNFYRDLKK
ncbi:MAG: type II toxin-antitoxin system RelE/ParE family toxin [Bacteroidetes bacterium]|nr:type II toxin-antitoxin system RelE/ParE family toxin [Bacteroidota bacterium]